VNLNPGYITRYAAEAGRLEVPSINLGGPCRGGANGAVTAGRNNHSHPGKERKAGMVMMLMLMLMLMLMVMLLIASKALD
jgi:hypothetical protein